MNYLLWGVVLVPCLAGGLVYAAVGRRPGWSALALVCVGPVLAVAAQAATDFALTADTETHTGFAAEVCYRESYTETVVETYVENGKMKVRTKQVYHGPEYWLTDTNGYRVNLDKADWVRLAHQFGEPNPPTEGWFTGSGRTHKVTWFGDQASAVVVSTRHHYRNPVQAGGSVFAFPDVSAADKEAFGLYDWPAPTGRYAVPCVLGADDPYDAVGRLNARVGREKQVRVNVLVFAGQGPAASATQEAYWKGGKKNELTLCVGAGADGVIAWTRAFCWGNEGVRAGLADHRDLVGKPFDAAAAAKAIEDEVVRNWVRKPFADFNHVTVEPPLWGVVLAYLFAAACGGGLAAADPGTEPRWRPRLKFEFPKQRLR